MRYLILVVSLFTTISAWSQFTVSGRLLNEQNQEGIEDAYLTLFSGDSLIGQGTSNKLGYFQIEASSKVNLTLFISHVAFQNTSRHLSSDTLKGLNFSLTPIVAINDEAVVKATRMGKDLPGTHTDISKKEIQQSNLGQDMPYLLNQVPGTVVNSDAGAGVGYTGMRIRGVDATRINVTINGIPVNDAESQGTYWVDMPDLATSVQSIQVQRGVGTSTNGAAAFGATINLQTNTVRKDPYSEVTYSLGFLQNNWTNPNKPNSWNLNTQKRNLVFGTGLMKNGWAFEGRVSQIKSNGFIDRSSSNLQSYFMSAAHYGKKSVFKVNVFGGKEITYQAWNGIPKPKVEGDAQGLKHYYELGADDSTLLANSGNRTYNAYTYNNEIDHYQQNHVQVHYSYQFNKYWNANISFHSTLGKGYYEQYKKDQNLVDYGLNPVILGSDTQTTTDLIRRRWLDNTFTGLVYSANYSKKKLNLIFGGAYNVYMGKHYGEIIWARFASNSEIRQHYYDNDAYKSDANVYAKAAYQFTTRLSGFVDLQYRHIYYSFLGYNNNGSNVTEDVNYNFFNPKFGGQFLINRFQKIYATFSRAHREPIRADFTNSTPETRPRPETLNDIEIGWNFQNRKNRIQVVAYHMQYKDQLILTGKINNVGAYTHVNVPNSFRQGIEVEYARNLSSWLQWNATLALSRNKVKAFTEYVDEYDSSWNYLGQKQNQYKNTSLSFSPNVVASSMFRFIINKQLSIDWISKYVSRQYLDNTQNKTRSLDPFWVNNLRLNFLTRKFSLSKELRVSVLANNVLNQKYSPNGYSYAYGYGGQRYDFNYLFPQAGTNFLIQATLAF
ncbi:MAG: TonB-dependent receptor [Bacteroidetes bacterium]|nr:TonB-dependent receptor [Bacteroidota bacterium]